MKPGPAAVRALWFSWWNAMRRYHRFEVQGLEHLKQVQGSCLIVGYHGRPVAHDLCMLQALLREQRAPEARAVMHAGAEKIPVLRWLVEGVGFVTGDGERMADAIARGEPIIVTPGGTREGCRSVRHRYRVDWGERLGYVRLALKYRLPIVPAAGFGVDDTYVGLNDGYAWGKKLRLPAGLPFWLGLGPLGLWPLSPPFPARIRLHLGAPIRWDEEGGVDPADPAQLHALHARVKGAVQALLDEAREARPHRVVLRGGVRAAAGVRFSGRWTASGSAGSRSSG